MSDIELRDNEAVFKYTGLAVNEGYLEAARFGKAMLGMDGVFDEISRSHQSQHEAVKSKLLVKVLPGSIEFWLALAAVGVVADSIGLRELGKQFFGEIGKQLALRLFMKNGEVKKVDAPYIKNGKLFYALKNNDGKTLIVNHETLELYKKRGIDRYLSEIIAPLEKGNIDNLVYSYNTGTVAITSADKPYFEMPEEAVEYLDVEEVFEEAKAEKIDALCGQFVTYKALASKYPFYFQVREKQNVYGKRFILCTLADEELRPKCLDLMKLRERNILISGFGIKNTSGQYARIKITSVEKSPDNTLFEC